VAEVDVLGFGRAGLGGEARDEGEELRLLLARDLEQTRPIELLTFEQYTDSARPLLS